MICIVTIVTGCSGEARAGDVGSTDKVTEPPIPAQAPRSSGTDSVEPDHPAIPPPVAGAVVTATRFAEAWARPALPADRWWAGVSPWCEQGFANTLRTADPANVPATRTTGRPRPDMAARDFVVYTVQTDGGMLTIRVAALAGRWLVTEIDFQRAGH